MLNIEFTDQQRAELARFLDETPSAMSLAQLEGYLFALVCAPTPSSVDEWVKAALGSELSTLSDDHLFLLMNFHNQVSDAVYETGYRFDVSEVTLPISVSSPAAQWSLGFKIGVAGYVPKLLNALVEQPELLEALTMSVEFLGFFATEGLDKTSEQDAQIQTALDAVKSSFDGFALGFAELIEVCALQSGMVAQDDW